MIFAVYFIKQNINKKVLTHDRVYAIISIVPIGV